MAVNRQAAGCHRQTHTHTHTEGWPGAIAVTDRQQGVTDTGLARSRAAGCHTQTDTHTEGWPGAMAVNRHRQQGVTDRQTHTLLNSYK